MLRSRVEQNKARFVMLEISYGFFGISCTPFRNLARNLCSLVGRLFYQVVFIFCCVHEEFKFTRTVLKK